MRILLINPPFKQELGKYSREQRSPAITKSGTFYYPMWLCYGAAALQHAGHHCVIIDAPARGQSLENILAKIGDEAFQLIVVDTATPSIANDCKAAEIPKAHFNAFTVLVGPHPSALPDETLSMAPTVDAVARGEYEATLVALSGALAEGQAPDSVQLATIDGLSYRSGNAIRHNANRKPITDLDALPFVSSIYRQHLNYRDYFYAHSKYPIVTLISGRGCPHRCVYCVYPQVFSGRTLRFRSIANVVDEIEYVLTAFPDVKEIMFEDDTLTINKNRCKEFADEILRRNIKFTWSANSRCDVDLQTLQLLKRAGARLFCVGVESGDQGVLDRMQKNLTVEQIRRFFKNSRQAGILIHGCFLVGNPGETKQTLEKTLSLAKDLNPDTAQFFPIMVYPGTAAYQWAVENDYLATRDFSQWLTADGLHNCIVSRPGLSAGELVAFCDRARKQYYLRPGYILKKAGQGLKDIQEMQRLLKGAVTFSRHLFKSNRSSRSC